MDTYEEWLRAEIEAAPPLSAETTTALADLFGGCDEQR